MSLPQVITALKRALGAADSDSYRGVAYDCESWKWVQHVVVADRVYCDGAGSESFAAQASDEGETQEGGATHTTTADSTGGVVGQGIPGL